MTQALLNRFRAGPRDPMDRVSIEVGSIADYARLASFHYLAGPPATHVRVLAARTIAQDREPETIGVLVVSMPTLDGAWRDAAWGGRYRARKASERSDCLKRLNAEVRTISRAVVDPRWRGLGVARRLVEAYLGEPLTERTEAVCAIGVVCPFFARAGMREVPMPVRRCTARLSDALSHAAGGEAAPEVLREPGLMHEPGFMRNELHRWWRDHKTTRDRRASPEEMAREAFGAIVSKRCAYVHGDVNPPDTDKEHDVNQSPERADHAPRAELPHPLTLFLSAGERSRVLEALKRIDPNRVRALMIALGLEPIRA